MTKAKKEVQARTIISIPIKQIKINENNVQYEFDDAYIERLALSIREDGLNNPLHVVKNDDDMYIINKGNKRYLACVLNECKEIECYVINVGKELEQEILELRLLRDNVSVYDRTIKDKLLEVEKYHKIAPKLKEFGYFKKGERTNEFIAREMNIADKSVKDYVSIIKVKEIYDLYLKDNLDNLDTALELVKVSKDKKKLKYYLEEINKRLIEGSSKKISRYHFYPWEWNYKKQVADALAKQEEQERKANGETQESTNCKNNAIEEIEEKIEEPPNIRWQETKILKVTLDDSKKSAKVIALLENKYADTKNYLLKIEWKENKVSLELHSLKDDEQENPLLKEVEETLIKVVFEREYEFKGIEFIGMIHCGLDDYWKKILISNKLIDLEEYFPDEFKGLEEQEDLG